MLEAYTNMCKRIESDRGEWKLREPVGIFFDQSSGTTEDMDLARAYKYLGVPIIGLPQLEERDRYGLEDARCALISRQQGKTVLQISFDLSPKYLESTDDNALEFDAINPGYNEAEYNADGMRKTVAQ